MVFNNQDREKNMIDFYILWMALSAFSTLHPYFAFEKPWYGPNRVWWSMIIHLPFVLLGLIMPVERLGEATGNSDDETSTQNDWSSSRF
jgi:hypothetical protein